MDSSNGELPLLPQFFVRFTNEIQKDGDAIKYKLRVGKPDNSGQETNATRTVEREYEDFEFLHHNLIVSNNINGIIVPPLPPKPVSDPKEAESKAKKQLGSGFKNIQGDDLVKDATALNKFMQQLLHHPVFGRDQHLVQFLENSAPPMRAKLKKSGFLAGMVKNTLESSALRRGSS